MCTFCIALLCVKIIDCAMVFATFTVIQAEMCREHWFSRMCIRNALGRADDPAWTDDINSVRARPCMLQNQA